MVPNTKVKSYPIVVQKWEESERGWGTRPDGWTMHLNPNALRTYLKKLADERASHKEVPDEYSRPCGSSYVMMVDEDTFNQIAEAPDQFIRGEGDIPPAGLQGKDGWKVVPVEPQPVDPVVQERDRLKAMLRRLMQEAENTGGEVWLGHPGMDDIIHWWVDDLKERLCSRKEECNMSKNIVIEYILTASHPDWDETDVRTFNNEEALRVDVGEHFRNGLSLENLKLVKRTYEVTNEICEEANLKDLL